MMMYLPFRDGLGGTFFHTDFKVGEYGKNFELAVKCLHYDTFYTIFAKNKHHGKA
mgnify:CR=1 FL=1|jgi:hypothetical protein